MTINKKFMFLIIVFYSFINYSFEHGIHSDSNDIQKYLEKYIINKVKNFSKLQQANIGAAIISSAPIPIFILILIFNIQNIKILDIMSSFAAGALIGDVFIHNLPEINHGHNHSHHNHAMNDSIMSKLYNLFEQNELLICWGILSLFLFEKLISYFEQRNIDKYEDKKVNKHHHGHGHENNHSNIVISLVGDFIHNYGNRSRI